MISSEKMDYINNLIEMYEYYLSIEDGIYARTKLSSCKNAITTYEEILNLLKGIKEVMLK